ncbi:MAG TPA: tetratricopeptide repeat protein [Deltaproteobacteria bacterium]|nr:tetratricopeptide repeat protein [Deltaproteobacteria bacterium]
MERNRQARVWVVIFVIILGLVLVVGCSSKEEKISSFIKKGNALLEKGDATRAILEFKNALQLDPKNVEAMFALGKAYLAEKKYRKAYAAFRSALETDPNFDRARIEIAALLSLARQGKMALDELKALKNPDKFEPKVSIIKARAFIAEKKYDDAIKVLNSIPKANENKEAQVLLCVCYKELGNFKAMMEAMKRWRKLDSKDPASYLFLAQYYLEEGNRAGASKELELMIKANPEVKLKLFRAQALERLGLIEEAKKAYDSLPETPEMLKARAEFWRRQGDMAKAKEIYVKLIKQNPKDVGAVVGYANVLASEGKIEEALKKLKETAKQDLSKEDHEKIILAEATLYAQQGEWDQAQKLCQDVLKENQANMNAHLLLGKIFLVRNKLEDAEIHLHQVAVTQTNNIEAQLLLARCQMLNKKESVAIDTLKKALKNNPASKKLRLELVRYHLFKKNYDQAINVLSKGITISPDDITYKKLRGEIYASIKKYDEAEKDFRDIVSAKPKSPLGYMELGRLRLTLHKPDEAITWFKKAYNAENGWQVAVPALVKTYLAKGNTDNALQVVKNEVKKRPDSALAYYYLGAALVAKGDLKGAEDAFKKTVELAPKWPEAYRALADLYLRQGKIAEATAQVEEIYKKSKSPSMGINLATLYEYQGKYKDAIDLYNELLKKYKKSPVLLNNLAYLYAEYSTNKKELEKAADMISQALALKPDTPNFLDTAGWIAYKQGKLNAAWNYIQDALSKTQDVPVIQLHAAILAHELGRKDQAADYLEKVIQQKLDHRSRAKALELKKKWGIS